MHAQLHPWHTAPLKVSTQTHRSVCVSSLLGMHAALPHVLCFCEVARWHAAHTACCSTLVDDNCCRSCCQEHTCTPSSPMWFADRFTLVMLLLLFNASNSCNSRQKTKAAAIVSVGVVQYTGHEIACTAGMLNKRVGQHKPAVSTALLLQLLLPSLVVVVQRAVTSCCCCCS
jgi:hypothetical protein